MKYRWPLLGEILYFEITVDIQGLARGIRSEILHKCFSSFMHQTFTRSLIAPVCFTRYTNLFSSTHNSILPFFNFGSMPPTRVEAGSECILQVYARSIVCICVGGGHNFLTQSNYRLIVPYLPSLRYLGMQSRNLSISMRSFIHFTHLWIC